MQFFILEGEEQTGPFSAEEIRQKTEREELSTAQLVWHEGLTEWQPLKQVFLDLAPLALAQIQPIKPPPIPSLIRGTASDRESYAWYDNIAVVVISFLLFPPLGLVALWLSKRFTKRVKVITTGIFAAPVIFVFLVILLAAIHVENAPNATSQPRQTRAEQPQPTTRKSATIPGAQEEQSRKEVLALLQELEGFRSDPQFHAKGFSRVGRGEWMPRIEAAITHLEKTANGDWNQTLRAAQNVKILGEEYQRSKGLETDSVRIIKESIEDAMPSSLIVVQREKTDFEQVLSGSNEKLFGHVPVRTLGDLIAGTMSGRIPWHEAERVVFTADGIAARLKSYDVERLLYEASTKGGKSVAFALKRTPELEAQIAAHYTKTTELYDELISGKASDLDPLRQGHVLLTDHAPLVDLEGQVELMNNYLSATGKKPLVSGSKVEVCFVRVIRWK